METECLAPETTHLNCTEQDSNGSQETQTPKDLLLWCSALKITPEEYNAMSDKELVLRINNLKGKLKLKVAKTLIARQKEQLDRIRARVAENYEEEQNINKYQRLFTMEKVRAPGGGEEILSDRSFSEPLSKENINSKDSYNCSQRYREPVHSTLPKVLRGFRKNNSTDFWKVITKAASDVERIYGGENNQRFDNFGNENDQYTNKNSEKRHTSRASKKLLNNPGTSTDQPTFLKIQKVPRTELPTTSDKTESIKMVHLDIKRSPERSQFSSRRESSLAQRRPQIEAAIIIEAKNIDENSKLNSQKKENMIELQSIQSYDINGSSNKVLRKDNPIYSYDNQPAQEESPTRPTNVIKYKQWDYLMDADFTPSDSDALNQNYSFDGNFSLSDSDSLIQNNGMQDNSYRMKSFSKQRQAKQNDHYVEDSISSYQAKRTVPIRESGTAESSVASHKPGRRIKLIQDNNVDGKIFGIRTVEDYRISDDIIEFEGVEGNQVDSTSTGSGTRRPIRVIQDNRIDGHILGIEGFEEDLVDGNTVEFQAIDDNRNSRARRRRA